MERKQILKQYLRSAFLIFIIETLFVVGSIYLLFFAYNSSPESGYRIKQRMGSILLGLIAMYLSFPCMVAAIKIFICIILDLYHKMDVTTRIHINQGMPVHLPYHIFHVVGCFSAQPKISIPFDIYWKFVFSQSYYLVDACFMCQKRKIRTRIGTKIVATKYAHIVLFVES